VVLVEDAHVHQFVDHSLEGVDGVDGVVCAVGALVNTDVNVGFPDGVAVLRGVTGQRLYPVLDFLPLPHLGGAVVADRQLGRDEHGELLPHFPASSRRFFMRSRRWLSVGAMYVWMPAEVVW